MSVHDRLGTSLDVAWHSFLLPCFTARDSSHRPPPYTPTPTEFISMRLEGLLRKENLKAVDLGKLPEKLSAIDEEWREGKMAAAGGQVVRGGVIVHVFVFV